MRNVIFISFISICLSSCHVERYIYNPPVVYNPIFEKKGESDISVRFSVGNARATNTTNGHNRGTDIEAAYAVTNGWVLTGSYTHQSERDAYDYPINNPGINNVIVDYKRHLMQMGTGFILPFQSSIASFSFYVFYGWGKNNINERGTGNNSNYTNFMTTNTHLFSIQPAINFYYSSNVTSSFIFRYTSVGNNNIMTDYTQDFRDQAGLTNIGNIGYSAFAYNLMIRLAKSPWLKFQGQLLVSVSGQANSDTHYARGLNASAGVSIDLKKIKGNRK